MVCVDNENKSISSNKMTKDNNLSIFDILNSIDKIEDKDKKVQAFQKNAPYLTTSNLQIKAIEIAANTQNHSIWQSLLIEIAPLITREVFSEVFDTDKYFNIEKRESTLINLSNSRFCPKFTLFKETLEITEKFKKKGSRTSIIENIIPRISDSKLIFNALKIGCINSTIDKTRKVLNDRFQQSPELIPSELNTLELANEFIDCEQYKAYFDLFTIMFPYLSDYSQIWKLSEKLVHAKRYDTYADLLEIVLPYLSEDSLSEALETALTIRDFKSEQQCINKMQELDLCISESFSRNEDSKFLFDRWQKSSDDWQCTVAELYRIYIIKWSNVGNLAIWRAIGNEVIDIYLRFGYVPRIRARILAILYYYFEGEKQTIIFNELLESIEQIPSKTCKVRSLVQMAGCLSVSRAKQVVNLALSVIKDIFEDIKNYQLEDEQLRTKFNIDFERIKEIENQLELQSIDNLSAKIKDLINDFDGLLFGYPHSRWSSNMISWRITDLLERLKKQKQYLESQIIFDLPNKMKAGVVSQATVRIAESMSGNILNELNSPFTYIEKGKWKITENTCVKLHAREDEFGIDPLTNECQAIEKNEYTEWAWSIKPLEKGNKKIIIVQSSIKIEKEKVKNNKGLKLEIDVEPNYKYTLKKIFTENSWQSIADNIIAIIGIIVAIISVIVSLYK